MIFVLVGDSPMMNAVGRTEAEAMYLAHPFTDTCKLQMQILQTNQEINIPTPEELEDHAR